MVFNASDFASASDYKYKVLDPKYNPEAEQLINGTLPPERTMPVKPKETFDIKTFLAIFALITFPFGIIYIAVKTFKDITSEYKEEAVLGNIKILKEKEAELINAESQKLINQKTVSKTNTKEIPNSFVKKYFTSPIEQIPNPMLLYTSPLSSNKGFCLVEYNQKYSLIGYINDEIFLLNQFDNIKTKEIRAKLAETQKNKERYIIKLDDYKALIEVSDQKMDLLINF